MKRGEWFRETMLKKAGFSRNIMRQKEEISFRDYSPSFDFGKENQDKISFIFTIFSLFSEMSPLPFLKIYKKQLEYINS
jgi:hypothetical protein